MMWVLLIITFMITPDTDKVTFLEKYATQDECYSERNRIMNEMQKSYPGESNYMLVCKYQGLKVKETL
jgi:hypothetical protein